MNFKRKNQLPAHLVREINEAQMRHLDKEIKHLGNTALLADIFGHTDVSSRAQAQQANMRCAKENLKAARSKFNG
jgi:hypothetical protein